MIVTMTSCAPVFALSRPGMKPQIAPPMAPHTMASGRWMTSGRPVNVKPARTASMPPMSSWPSPPMLNRPARKARATARPVKISGVASVRVWEMARSDPTDPCRRAR